MAELADALDLGSSTTRCAGSSPVTRTSSQTSYTCRCGGMADALASGASARKGVRVQVPPSAPKAPIFGAFLFAFDRGRKRQYTENTRGAAGWRLLPHEMIKRI